MRPCRNRTVVGPSTVTQAHSRTMHASMFLLNHAFALKPCFVFRSRV